jgi:hypothetical protein
LLCVRGEFRSSLWTNNEEEWSLSDLTSWKRTGLRQPGEFHPAGTVLLDDLALDDVQAGTTWACATFGATVAISLQWCSPSGTLCGSCAFGTSGCCR